MAAQGFSIPTRAVALIDRQYLALVDHGSRRMAAWLATQGHVVNRKRVRRLMRLIGLVAIYQRPNTSKAAAAHKVYPYLLGGIAIGIPPARPPRPIWVVSGKFCKSRVGIWRPGSPNGQAGRKAHRLGRNQHRRDADLYRLPRQHHKHLKLTNMLERLNEEIRRRTQVVRICLPGRA